MYYVVVSFLRIRSFLFISITDPPPLLPILTLSLLFLWHSFVKMSVMCLWILLHWSDYQRSVCTAISCLQGT